MENRLYFRSGGKSYDITETISQSEIWFDWVESAKLSIRRMVLSKGAILWLCRRIKEASANRGKNFKSWRCTDFSTNIYCTQKFNKYGRFISVITVKGQSRSVIILPENSINEGWGNIALKVEEFINRKQNDKGAFITCGEGNGKPFAGKGNYLEAFNKSKWGQQKIEVAEEGHLLKTNLNKESNELLRRCLVGRFCECDEIPTRNDVRRWAQNTWKGAPNTQVYDMNGFQFPFEFQSRKAAEDVLMGEWQRQGSYLKLDWWSPTKGTLPEETRFDWFWVRVIGLPLQLWNNENLKLIGDECGGWLENEEETELKNHLRWARIKVKGPREKISYGNGNRRR